MPATAGQTAWISDAGAIAVFDQPPYPGETTQAGPLWLFDNFATVKEMGSCSPPFMAEIARALGEPAVCGMANGDRGEEPFGERVARLYGLLRPHLDERQRRLLLGAEALELGRGGIRAVAEATGVHPDTVGRGVREAEGRPEPRVRAPGGGRKKLAQTDLGLGPALMALVDPETRGDPQSPLRWTCLSTRNLAGTLTRAGHRCSAPTVARLLKAEGYSLQGNAKVAEGAQHPGRDAQFRYIAGRAREYLDAGQPVISVDAKKKETAPRGALPYP